MIAEGAKARLRLISIFGTVEPEFANLMLDAIIDAGTDENSSHLPGCEHINVPLLP